MAFDLRAPLRLLLIATGRCLLRRQKGIAVRFPWSSTTTRPASHSQAKITLVNQTPAAQIISGCARASTISAAISGMASRRTRLQHRSARSESLLSRFPACGILRPLTSSLRLLDAAGKRLVGNVYWQSTTDDDLGDPANDSAFDLREVSWANHRTRRHAQSSA